MIEGYISSIDNDRLRRAATDVWRRLPAYAREYLIEVNIPIRLMTPEEAEAYPVDMGGGLHWDPDAEHELEIIIRPDPSDARMRFCVSHEFAHAVLQHHLRGPMGFTNLKPEPSKFLREWEDEVCTFLQVRWGFGDEFYEITRKQSGKKPAWLEAQKNARR